ncbi:ABC-2 type transport system permease protein [Sphingomonas naasensis]|uniref:Transport permease protein n=1 Tax=Sphingomonas naasensis TaxID=1344951 RepID=A0A4S1WSD3_9SPHN|nr:ABC transporter permease [Sphingomonas naasensis]NIJ19107.1 ABC-2 type transport system permease protein [Sphingomonas naasensis]TGX46301.1 ABC transporter permease [Sphingomonas naasensis]
MGRGLSRLWAMIVKEMLAVLRDPKSRVVLVVPPILQLFIFTYATTLDVTNVDIGLLDRSSGAHSVELVQRISGSPNFRDIRTFRSTDELRAAIDNQKVIAAMVIDEDFDRKLASGQPATIGLVLDGRRSNAAQIVSGYLTNIVGGLGADLQPRGAAGGGSVVTNWYNPSLDYIWFTLPSLVAIITSVAGLAITSQSVAREREMGTFDQLMVSPLRVHEILIGKMVPPYLLGMFNGSLYLILAPLVFGVPFKGSLALFFLSLSVYMLALIGLGMLISAASKTMQQAFLGVFLIMTPLILLSGYASPIDNMPGWLQTVTYIDPARYFLIIVQGLFLKAMPATAVFHQLWPLVLIACATLSASAWLFRARME